MNKNPLKSTLKFACSLVTTLFGKFNWSSPPWVTYLNKKAHSSPKSFWSSVFITFLLIITAGYGLYWYQHLPKPTYITTSITPPGITPNEEILVPQNLVIHFGIKQNEFINQSVAPLGNIGKTITKDIEITPQIKGQWFWNSDSELVFTPSEDWPANQQFTIHFSPHFFAPNVHFENYDVSFTTQPFEAKISEFKFYQDPVNADIRNAVATIQFNYPVNPDSLEKNTELLFQAKNKEASTSKKDTLSFSYTYDTHKRIAWLHSEPIKIKEVERYLLLTLGKKVQSSTQSGQLNQSISQNLLIPDSSTFLKIVSSSASIIRNEKDRPEQILNIETSIGVNESEFNQSIHAYLLPLDFPASAVEPAKPNYSWQVPGEVTESILKLSTPLTKETIPVEHNYSTLHSFRFAAQTPRYIYLKIDKGMKGMGGFTLKNDYKAIIPVPELPKEISFLHKGSLLALGGEKKLSVLIRGVPAVKFDFARVLPTNINQLVTQTQGDFNNPYFINPSFNQQNISQIFSETQQFDASDFTKQQYTALDLAKYLSNETNQSGPNGLFLLQATGWDNQNNVALDVKASRMILITDLGLLVKDNTDGTHDVFVESITQGTPVSNVNVSILGKNGLPILTRITDAQGRATFPSLNDFVEDREPTVYIANYNNDVSFIPFNNSTRQLNFSKFDIGGLYSYHQETQSLGAFLFSDRGIYRPGDTVHVGMIVKQAYVQPQAAGLPLELTIVDSRGNTIKDEKLSLNDTGYMSVDFSTQSTAPTGQYMVNLYLVKDNHAQNILGSTSIQVSEFQPDRMRITSHFIPNPSDGWISPVGLKAKANLWNLYGAPASNRKVSAKLLLSPQTIHFKNYPDYVFADPLFDPKKPPKVFSESLNETKTNDQGEAEFNLNLDRFEKATYKLTFFAEGFEAESGRSVTTQTQALVSPLPYFIGYKTDGDLSFIKQNSRRSIHYVAVNPQLSKEEISGLKIQLALLRPVTTLVKKADGTYQYQSIIQSSIVTTNPLNISADGTTYELPTQQIGDYSLSILGKDDTVLSQLKFSVVGASQTPLAKNAELSIKLDKSEYKANEAIQLQITAPYTGSGLITIERDKVYATQWFKTNTTNSIQTIRVPADFQGNGYVNVAFIRDWDSPELFVSPLSYSVQPFEVNHDNHHIQIDLKAPEAAKPGEALTIDYHTDKPGKIIVFAVDEGILQVAHYTTPNPLSYFFQKRALEVLTQQTVDQILPKFIQDRELSAAGGDGGEEELAGRLNPFKRKTDLPVVYWSGIIDTDTTNRQLTYRVPDYFNGSLRIMAVAVSNDSVGSKETTTTIKGDFIINPNVPTFVTPGDEFVVSASVANNMKDSGDHAQIKIDLTVSPEIEVIGHPSQTLEISEGHEQSVQFKLRAKSLLGSAKVNFKASSGGSATPMDATLSVRPANPFFTLIESGQSDKSKETLDILQTLYPEYRKSEAILSTNPLVLVFGLQRYLENYPYVCTEQLTSKALPLIAMNSQSAFTKDSSLINTRINEAIQMLSQRQMSNGGFSYWPGLGENPGNNFSSVYAMHFLTEAKTQGFTIPSDLFYNGISYLKELANQTPNNLETARLTAYAIYILTRNELVTTNYLDNLQLFLQKDTSKEWQNDITALYIAASYQMLKNFEDANRLLNQYHPKEKQHFDTDFYDRSIVDAQYLYILAKHFPNRLNQLGHPLVMQLVKAINNSEINTVLSGYVSLAFSAYQQTGQEGTSPSLSITEILTDNTEKTIPSSDTNYLHIEINDRVKQLILNNPSQNNFFYQLMQSGFDKTLPNEPLKQGIEIYREYRDAHGHVVDKISIGNELEVHIQIRALDNNFLSNIAIEDLLPGGFEVVQNSVKGDYIDFFDIREDRVNFFTTIDSSAHEIIYKIKATNSGQYIIPPIYAESMYNPTIKGRGIASKITVQSFENQ